MKRGCSAVVDQFSRVVVFVTSPARGEIGGWVERVEAVVKGVVDQDCHAVACLVKDQEAKEEGGLVVVHVVNGFVVNGVVMGGALSHSFLERAVDVTVPIVGAVVLIVGVVVVRDVVMEVMEAVAVVGVIEEVVLGESRASIGVNRCAASPQKRPILHSHFSALVSSPSQKSSIHRR
jgi:hypothetical protein